MTKPRLKLSFVLLAVCIACAARAQPQPEIIIEAPEGKVVFDPATGVAYGTNGVIVSYGTVVLTADSASFDPKTGETAADGRVRIQMDDQIWAGEHIRYNFKTRQM